MKPPFRVLMIARLEKDVFSVLHDLTLHGYDPFYQGVETPESMAAALAESEWDIVIHDYDTPSFSLSTALEIIKRYRLDLPLIVLSSLEGEEFVVEAIKAGANDYVRKGDIRRLNSVVESELHRARVRKEINWRGEEAKHLSQYDSLTDLPNRTLLRNHLKVAIEAAQKKNHALGLLLMDLDHFKEINDTLGHDHGDVLLQKVGSLLQDGLFNPDIVSRLGGDEFAVLLPRLAASEDFSLVISKIRKALDTPIVIGGLPIHVEASIGIGLYPDHGTDPVTLMQCAEIAMYTAKRNGSGHEIYTPEQNQHTPRRLAMMGELHRAIEHNQLVLNYQPKIDLKTRQIFGLEALVRWEHPTYGFMPPDQFIASAERTGLINQLTRWVLDEALSQCRSWHLAGFNFSMAVNLSVRCLTDRYLPDFIQDSLQRYGLKPEVLELEVTESMVMANPLRAREVLATIEKSGIRLSLDDFGTGYASLEYLKNLPFYEIKVDKTFVGDMIKDPSSRAIVRSAIDLGHTMGLQVIAEGVETREVWDQLLDLGCDSAQGFYMCRPLHSEKLSEWLGQSDWG